MLLRNVYSNGSLSEKTKIKIFHSNIKSVLLYGSETRIYANPSIQRVQTFINRCLRSIRCIHWPETISNERLWERTKQAPVEEDLKRSKWKWIKHTLRRDQYCFVKQSLTWNPQEKRSRGRLRVTWRRDVEAEMRREGHSWARLDE